jgi:hypothetical protein
LYSSQWKAFEDKLEVCKIEYLHDCDLKAKLEIGTKINYINIKQSQLLCNKSIQANLLYKINLLEISILESLN